MGGSPHTWGPGPETDKAIKEWNEKEKKKNPKPDGFDPSTWQARGGKPTERSIRSADGSYTEFIWPDGSVTNNKEPAP